MKDRRRTMEQRITVLMARMARRHATMRATWYGAFLSPVILVLGFLMLIVGIIILPTPAPGWLLIFVSLGMLSLVYPPMRRLNIRLAALYDVSESWFRRQHLLRSEEHTSELQSRFDLVCRLLLEKKKQIKDKDIAQHLNTQQDTAREQ